MGSFKNILGNENIKEHFLHAISSGHISHCYILNGEDGLGKRMIAEAFAQTLLCESDAKERPCGHCPSCLKAESGNHPDIIYASHSKPTVIGVDDVRDQIVGDIQIKPYSSEYKIYIIDEAEKLSAQAQNALLKTIEEPPAYGIIIMLTTNAAGMLETIRSRSIILDVKPVSEEEFKACMAANGVEAEKIDTLEKFAQGNIGKGLKLAQSEHFIQMVQLIMRILKNIGSMSLTELLENIAQLEEYKLDIKDCFGFMLMWYRDVLLLKATADPNLLIFKDEISAISRIAQKCGYEQINHIIEAIETASVRIDANVSYQTVLELLLINIKDNQPL